MTAKTAQKPTTPRESLRSMRIISIGMLTGILLFGVFMLLLVSNQGPVLDEQKGLQRNIFMGVAVITAVICQYFAHTIFRRKLTETKNDILSLQERLNQYTGALLLYLALCEAPGLLAIIFFFLTGDYFLLIITALVVFFMISKFPTTSGIIDELELDGKDQQELL